MTSLIFRILFCLAIPNLASAKSFLKISLLTETNLKFKNLNSLTIEGQKIIYNLGDVAPAVLPAISSEIQTLSHVVNLPGEPCAAGLYTLRVVKNKSENRETGCLESPRAAELMQAFGRIAEVSGRAQLPAK